MLSLVCHHVSGQAPAMKSLNHVRGIQMHLVEQGEDKGAKTWEPQSNIGQYDLEQYSVRMNSLVGS